MARNKVAIEGRRRRRGASTTFHDSLPRISARLKICQCVLFSTKALQTHRRRRSFRGLTQQAPTFRVALHLHVGQVTPVHSTLVRSAAVAPIPFSLALAFPFSIVLAVAVHTPSNVHTASTAGGHIIWTT